MTAQVLALDTDQAKNIGVLAILAVLVVGLLLAVLVSKLVIRAIVVIVMIGLALLAYQQRDHVAAAAKRCDASFFGIHVQPHDPTFKARCEQLTNR